VDDLNGMPAKLTKFSTHTISRLQSSLSLLTAQIEQKMSDQSYVLVTGLSFAQCLREDSNRLKVIGEQILYSTTRGLGTALGFESQRKGVLVQNITPDSKTSSRIQSGTNMESLDWHTEDASLKYCCDFLALFCLYNDSETATNIVDLWNCAIPADLLGELMKPQFIIKEDMPFDGELNNPQPLVTHYNRKFQFRIDPLFTTYANHTAKRAMDSMLNLMEQHSTQIRLRSGDLLILNNNLCAHGREKIVYNNPKDLRHLQRLMVFQKSIPPQNIDHENRVVRLKPLAG